jgi:hypothetical protein
VKGTLSFKAALLQIGCTIITCSYSLIPVAAQSSAQTLTCSAFWRVGEAQLEASLAHTTTKRMHHCLITILTNHTNDPLPVSFFVFAAVRFGAWVKRTFSLKPALERIREGRREARNPELLSQQVERMR